MKRTFVTRRSIGGCILLGLFGLNVAGIFGEAEAGPTGPGQSEKAEMGPLAFDVASVKVNRSGGRDMLWDCRGTDGKTLSEVKATP
jgi:hypothetical protein